MKKSFNYIDLSGVKTRSLDDRKSKVSISEVCKPVGEGITFQGFLNSLPNILAAKDLKEVASAIAHAHSRGKIVAIGMGAHVIKVGLSPIIIDFMERGIISSVAMNGAGIVHDFELAYCGQTSEDVGEELKSGSFGMAEETGKMLNESIIYGAKKNRGIGRSVGEMIIKENLPNMDKSILAAGARLQIPVTVHVAVGTDIIHMHPESDGASIGKGSLLDFRLFSSVISELEKGVYLNIGSAVLLPEVFLKALTLARNIGHDVKKITTVNMDFIQHYRPLSNVVRRPTEKTGAGYALTGHHEIMLPLLFASVLEKLAADK